MAKKRKTKEQKKLADLRHTFAHSENIATTSSFDLKPVFTSNTQVKTTSIPLNSYPYLMKDLSKTAILTIGILFFQIILFTALRNHFFVIPGLNY